MAARLQDKLKTQLKTAGKGSNTDITKYKYRSVFGPFYFKNLPKNENVRKMLQQL